MVFGRSSAVTQLKTIGAEYPAKADIAKAVVQDFHSVRQAVNVASADQRVLVLINGPKDELEPLRNSLRAVTNDARIVGRFHFDFEPSDAWRKTAAVTGLKDGPGVIVIRPGEFGMSGVVMHRLPLDADNTEIVEILLAANANFARTTKKKDYSDHVFKGRSLGIYFKGAVPYGEDRDGDGQIDQERRGGRRPDRPQGRRPQ